MASSTTMSVVVMMVAVLLVSTSTTTTQAQNIANCAQKLIPCGEYLNTTTTPPESCCGSIKDAVKNDLTCLCNLYNTPGLLQSFNVNVTQAIALTKRCGVNADLTACGKDAAEPTAAIPPPPGVPGNDGNKMAWTGFSGLLLLWASSLIF
ncbi:non-specific lipid transfer protein GPI-anchored 7 isoform X2 [Manihot esculenta]|uniref:Bifunctional inhibitor/plant lipid transfer protein/seed storage helical domain-containing protein n=1 Tax=Manihot esculenta TaxID=3983 RepID=A0A2C9WAW6_MANES|nr:non-specific lipid transfer protein GPI-anchored 7 isoform X2 [Manihot esculenta]OAY56652.1 hypothetical protein MANES_02G034500v8 [Manihot esculenta]